MWNILIDECETLLIECILLIFNLSMILKALGLIYIVQGQGDDYNNSKIVSLHLYLVNKKINKNHFIISRSMDMKQRNVKSPIKHWHLLIHYVGSSKVNKSFSHDSFLIPCGLKTLQCMCHQLIEKLNKNGSSKAVQCQVPTGIPVYQSGTQQFIIRIGFRHQCCTETNHGPTSAFAIPFISFQSNGVPNFRCLESQKIRLFFIGASNCLISF